MSSSKSIVSLVIKKFCDQISANITEILPHLTPTVQFDPEQSVLSAIRATRNDSNMEETDLEMDYDPTYNENTDFENQTPDLTSSLPIVAWNRSVLRLNEPIGRKGVGRFAGSSNDSNLSKSVGRWFQGEFDLFITVHFADMADYEVFELEYFSEQGLMGIEKAVLSFLDSNNEVHDGVVYKTKWEQLESIDNQLMTNSYISVTFQVNISGVFFTFERDSKYVLNTNLTLER